jgi:hypothetical protein
MATLVVLDDSAHLRRGSRRNLSCTTVLLRHDTQTNCLPAVPGRTQSANACEQAPFCTCY